MSVYRSVKYLAYRVSVSASAAGNYAREAAVLALDASRLEIRGGADYYDLVVPEIQAQAARATAAASRAQAALERSWSIARIDPRGPVIRVSDGRSLLFDEDDGTRAAIAKNFGEAQAGRSEAHLALDIIKAVQNLITEVSHKQRRGRAARSLM